MGLDLAHGGETLAELTTAALARMEPASTARGHRHEEPQPVIPP